LREYVFTERERRLIDGFFKGEVNGSTRGWSQLVYRIRCSTRLSKDVDLYLELSRRLAKPETT